jgi:hypothetical protein
MKWSTALFRVLICFVISLLSCKHSTEPLIQLPDSTSHNFLWQIDTLGDGNSSVLYDVAIINDTLAYAVGDISVRDSTGGFRLPPYNLARWNGKRWELLTLIQSGFGYEENYCVVAFGPNDIWIGGTVPKHWDGSRWKFYGLSGDYTGGFRIRAIGGMSSRDLYCSGDEGNLRHFDGSAWQVVQSGTTAQIQDIWAGSNLLVGSDVALMTAADKFAASDRKILRARQGGVVDTIAWRAELQRPVHSVWFDNKSDIFVSGTGVFSYDGKAWTEKNDVPLYFTNRIRGNSPQDIIVVGDVGIVSHYNGSSWRTYLELMLPVDQYTSLAIKGTTVIAVGYKVGKAVVILGKR